MQPYLAMLNAFLHDFSVAMLFMSVIFSYITLNYLKQILVPTKDEIKKDENVITSSISNKVILKDKIALPLVCNDKKVVFSSESAKKNFLYQLSIKFYKITLISLFFVLVLGGVRTYFYYEYEWLPALGRKQVPALIIKHIIFVVGTIFAVVKQHRIVGSMRVCSQLKD